MTNEMVKSELIEVNYESENPTVSGRDLHEALEVKTAYKDWFPRMCEYGFNEGEDFNPLKIERLQIEGDRTVNREVIDHELTIPMAKEICMLQRNDKGKEFRKYFISVEEKWNSPEMVMVRAVKLADKEIIRLKTKNQKLIEEKTALETRNEILESNTLAWADRPLLNAIIRRYSTSAYGLDGYAFSKGWTDFKKELSYKLGININSRITNYLNKTGKRTKPKTLDMLTDDEMVDALKSAVSLCGEKSVNISDLLSNKKSANIQISQCID